VPTRLARLFALSWGQRPATYAREVPGHVRVEWFWEGKVRVFRLPDGKEFRMSPGSRTFAYVLVQDFLRESRGFTDFRLSFHQIEPPRGRTRRRSS
jgi:hypothetical protein